jgi:hypothetical protein
MEKKSKQRVAQQQVAQQLINPRMEQIDLSQNQPSQREIIEQFHLVNKPKKSASGADWMIGKRFGRWVILEPREKPGTTRNHYLCRCDCGTQKVHAGAKIRSGSTTKCIKCARKDHAIRHRGWQTRKANSPIKDMKQVSMGKENDGEL